MSAVAPLFRFVQVEFAWPLGPPDGRYLLRPPERPEADPAHVIVFATLGAPERRRLTTVRKQRDAPARPAPRPVATGRATVIDVARPLSDSARARVWLQQAGEDEVDRGLQVLNRALHAFRLITADPHLHTVGRRQALVARVGFGHGEDVADGLWTDARELLLGGGRPRRARVLQPQARLAAVLGAREEPLVCEELALRAHQDLDQGHDREAALQVLVALDAALAELARDPTAAALADRLVELREQRERAAVAAQSALAGPLAEGEREAVAFTLSRIESALRARAVANA